MWRCASRDAADTVTDLEDVSMGTRGLSKRFAVELPRNGPRSVGPLPHKDVSPEIAIERSASGMAILYYCRRIRRTRNRDQSILAPAARWT
jgi:hypothetical protein